MSSAIIGTGPTKDNGPLIRTQQAMADRVVVLVRGAPGLGGGSSYRLCRPDEPISILEFWTAGYKNYSIVSTVEAEEERVFTCETADHLYNFDVKVKVRGRVVDAVEHLRDVAANVSRFDGIFSAVENALREAAKTLFYQEFNDFKARLQSVSEQYRQEGEVQNGVLILRCDFDPRPGAELQDELRLAPLLGAWYKEGGKDFVYAKAATSTDPKIRANAERFIRAMELREEHELERRRRQFDASYYEAEKRVQLQGQVNALTHDALERLTGTGMEPELAARLLGISQSANATHSGLSHERQLLAANPDGPRQQAPTGLLRQISHSSDKPEEEP